MKPPVLLLHCRADSAPARLEDLCVLVDGLQVVSVSAVPAGPSDLRCEAAVVVAAGLAHRGVPTVVVGDLGNAVGRDSLCLLLAQQGLTAAVIEDEGHEHRIWPTLTVSAGQNLSSQSLTDLLEKAQRSREPLSGAIASRYAVLLRHGHASYPGPAFPSPEAAFPRDRDLALTPLGKAQVHTSALALRPYAPDIIYSSSLRRARQSARVVADVLGGTEIVYDSQLNEREFTPLHGLTADRITALYGAKFLRAFTTKPDEVTLDGVDTLSDCQARVVRFFEELNRIGAERPLVVAHGGPFSWLASFAMGISLDKSRRWHMGHAALSTIDIGPPLRLVSWNARCIDPAACA